MFKILDEGTFYKVRECYDQKRRYVGKIVNMNEKLSCDSNGKFYVPTTERKYITTPSSRMEEDKPTRELTTVSLIDQLVQKLQPKLDPLDQLQPILRELIKIRKEMAEIKSALLKRHSNKESVDILDQHFGIAFQDAHCCLPYFKLYNIPKFDRDWVERAADKEDWRSRLEAFVQQWPVRADDDDDDKAYRGYLGNAYAGSVISYNQLTKKENISYGNSVCRMMKQENQRVDVQNLEEGIFYKISGCSYQKLKYVGKMVNMKEKLSCDSNGKFYVPTTERNHITTPSSRSVSLA
ncbi:hypothetical protein GQR58_011711 [Nymphon striatum]|nr:hypothetical protein GQR58_011711 [Nymphon striatum]